MTTKDFQKLWKEIANKPVNIDYGKQTFRNVILTAYKPMQGIVKTGMSGELNTRAIKAISLVEHKQEPVAVEAEVVTVTPRLPDDWNKNGYFCIVGKFGQNWKYLELRDKKGDIKLIGAASMNHQELFTFAIELVKTKKLDANVIVDDTWCAPQYYFINKQLSISKIT